MNKQKLLEKLKNSQKNVRYGDFVMLINAFGFEYDRTRGSHNTYMHLGIHKVINIQNNKGQAKPYQIKQFLEIINECNLELEGESND